MDSDGQEIQFRFASSNQSDHFNSPQQNYYQRQQIEQYFNNHHQFHKQLVPTGILSDQPYQLQNLSENNLSQSQKNVTGLFNLRQSRNKKFIDISRKTKQKYIICKKGNKRQTSLLNINFKTFLSSLLKQYLIFNNITKYQKQVINQFFSAKANFMSFQKLYGVQGQMKQKNQQQVDKSKKVIINNQHDNIRKFLLQRFQSGSFIQKVMMNRKMSYDNKISIIKFCQQIRNSCITPQLFNNWKGSNFV